MFFITYCPRSLIFPKSPFKSSIYPFICSGPFFLFMTLLMLLMILHSSLNTKAQKRFWRHKRMKPKTGKKTKQMNHLLNWLSQLSLQKTMESKMHNILFIVCILANLSPRGKVIKLMKPLGEFNHH